MIVDFMVRTCFGVNGSGLHESFRLSVVSGLLFTTAMTSYRNVRREEESSCLADCSKIDIKTLLMVRICLSQTPPKWLEVGVLKMNSHPLSLGSS